MCIYVYVYIERYKGYSMFVVCCVCVLCVMFLQVSWHAIQSVTQHARCIAGQDINLRLGKCQACSIHKPLQKSVILDQQLALH